MFALLAVAASRAGAVEVEVEISGLAPELERNVRAFLSIAELAAEEDAGDQADREADADDVAASGEADVDAVSDSRQADADADGGDEDIPESRVRRLHAAAREEIAVALQPFGYYEPSVVASLEPDGDSWIARYEIRPGRRTLLTEIDIRVIGEASDLPPVRNALSAIMLAPGVALLHQQYEAAKATLFDAVYGAGFIDAAYQRSELLVNRGAREAEIHLVLDSGPRYYFGEVTVEQEILNESFVDRFVPMEYGDPFDTDQLLALQIALNNSGYFSEVVIDVGRERAENYHVPVVVYTSPRKTQEYTLGLGYGTDTGPRVSIGVELRRINPLGHRFDTNMRVSNIEQAVAAEYRIPARNLATDYLSLRATLGNEEIGSWDTRALGIGATWHDAWQRMQRRIYTMARREEFSTDLTETARADVVFAGVQLTSQESDNQLYPRRGHSWSVDLRGGSEAVLSSTTFARMHATGNVVRSLGDRIRLLLRAEYGAIQADDFAMLPPSQRFYAGGDRSVRGYGFQELSTRDANGASIGGRYLFVAAAELEFMIVGNYGAALFFDAGNAGSDRFPDPQRGVGIGARWRSPVGVVGIDLAHPLDDPDTDFRVHLSVGADL